MDPQRQNYPGQWVEAISACRFVPVWVRAVRKRKTEICEENIEGTKSQFQLLEPRWKHRKPRPVSNYGRIGLMRWAGTQYTPRRNSTEAPRTSPMYLLRKKGRRRFLVCSYFTNVKRMGVA